MKAAEGIERRDDDRPGAGRKKLGLRNLMLCVPPPSLVERLDRVTDNRSGYIAELLDKVLPTL